MRRKILPLVILWVTSACDNNRADVQGQVERLDGAESDGGTPDGGQTPRTGPTDITQFIVDRDLELGPSWGTIDVPPGDHVISGQDIVLHPGHRLHLGAGHYTTGSAFWHATFLMQDDTTIEGDGWDKTIVTEPPGYVFAMDYNETIDGQAPGNHRLSVHDMKFVQYPGPTTQLCCPATIQPGDSTEVTVHDVWFDHVHNYGVESGLPQMPPSTAHGGDVRIFRNKFVGLGMPIAITNSDNFLIADNYFEDTVYGVDVEPNTGIDFARHGTIINNTGSFSVLIQTEVSGDIVVSYNTLWGAVIYNSDHVEISHNVFPGYSNPAWGMYDTVFLGGARRCALEWNDVRDRGYSPVDDNPAITLTTSPSFYDGHLNPATENVIRHNHIYAEPGFNGSATIRERYYYYTAPGTPVPDHNDVQFNTLGPAGDPSARDAGRVITMGSHSTGQRNSILP
jgi:hypothetical protein